MQVFAWLLYSLLWLLSAPEPAGSPLWHFGRIGLDLRPSRIGNALEAGTGFVPPLVSTTTQTPDENKLKLTELH